MNTAREKQIAIDAVTHAARLCQAVRSESLTVATVAKDDRSPVTVADFGSQALICRRLAEAFPRDPIVAEEDSSDLRQHAALLSQVTHYTRRFQADATPETICDWIDAGSGGVADRFWTLDPIDGTKGFLRNDQYAIALALIEQGQVQVAALACPALPFDVDDPEGKLGVMFIAVRGEGAAMAPLSSEAFMPIQVRPTEDRSRARCVASVEADHGNSAVQEAVARAVGITLPPLRMDSQAKYGVVARSDAALYLRLPSPKSPDYREKIWDHAAGTLIVEEAGGRVTDMRGQTLDFGAHRKLIHNRGVVASHGALHAAVIAALAEATSIPR